MKALPPIAFALLMPMFALASTGEPDKPTSHTRQTIEGWTVHVDDRLLDGEHAEIGKRALALLRNRLEELIVVFPAEKLPRLRDIPIWLDATHGGLRSMEYHPCAGWHDPNGYSRDLARAVHIPVATRFADPNHHRTQPWCVLHELAHAYHDQVLGFEHAEIKTAWERFRESGRYLRVLHINGKHTRHYALTDQKEFFAEMSEAYFGMNDFFPFNRAELRIEEPEIYALLEKIWG